MKSAEFSQVTDIQRAIGYKLSDSRAFTTLLF